MAGKASENKKRYIDGYHKANTTTVCLRLSKLYDQDVIKKLEEVGNKGGYIKALVRKDMEEKRDIA